jgi:predicted methyltransferase
MRLIPLFAAASTLVLIACGERGPSEEMLENEGEANAPSTTIEDVEGATLDGPGEERDFEESDIALPPGGDADDEEDYQGEGDDQERGAARDLEPGSLAAIVADERRAEDSVRDPYRNPAETLRFFGLEPDMTVVEVWPGGGYYTRIIAPYLAEGGGTYYAAGFDPEAGDYQRQRLAEFSQEFGDEPETYGDVNLTVLSAEVNDIAPAGSADMVLTFRNVHNFVMNEFDQAAFEGFYEALKPGGILGVVDHRLPEGADAEMERSSGYVKPSTVLRLAREAGFEFVGASEVNANPQDTADHPYGVWTLPPTSRTEGRDGTALGEGDAARYAAIGESDRFTMKFVKPLGADGALME